MSVIRKVSALIAGVTAAALFAGSASAADPAAFFKGKTITYIVATAPGGGYDTYGRLIAKHMEKFIPGVRIIVKNVPGAGHIIGANQVYAAKPDGLTIGTFNTGLIYAQLQNSEGIKFDLSKFTYIGKASTDPRVVVVSNSSSIKSIDELKTSPTKIKFAASGVGSAAYNEEKMLIDSLGWNVEVIPGYNGKDDEMAMLREEVQGSVGSLSSYDQFVLEQHGHYILQIGGVPPAGVPSASTMVTSGRGKSVIALINSQGEIGRLTAAPPGLPPERAKVLVDAYRQALESKDLKDEAAKLSLPVEPLYGEDVGKMVKDALSQDNDTVAMLKALANAEPAAPTGNKLTTPLVSVSDGGKEVTFKAADGSTVKSVLSSTRTKLSIGGKEGDRKNLKAGMTCNIVYAPGSDNEPSVLDCK